MVLVSRYVAFVVLVWLRRTPALLLSDEDIIYSPCISVVAHCSVPDRPSYLILLRLANL